MVIAPIIVFAGGLAGRRLFAPGDGYQQYIPWYTLAARAWRTGHLPTWNPFAYSGAPFLASNQPAVFYPPNLLFTFLPPLLANNLSITITFAIAGVGAWLLARHLWKDDVGAAVAGIAFAFSGFMFGHVGHQGMIATAAWLPWILFGFELARERFSPGRWLLGSGALALSFLAGHSQIVFVSILALALYAGFLSLLDWRSTKGRPILLAGAIVLGGLALAAVQLFPTIATVGATTRSRIPYVEAMSYSFPKSHLALLGFPYLFGSHFAAGPYAQGYGGLWNLTEMSGYPGMAAAVLAAVGIGAIRRDRRVAALGAVGLVTLALAMGPATPLSRLFFRLPVYGQFRSWARYIVVVDLVVALLAGYGVAVLRNQPRRAFRTLLPGLAMVSLIAGAAIVLPGLEQIRRLIPHGLPAPAALIVPAAAGGLGIVCAFLLLRHSKAGTVAVVLLIALDGLLSFGWFYEWRTGGHTIRELNRDLDSSMGYSWGRVEDVTGGIDRYLFVGGNVGPIGREFVHVTDMKRIRSANGNDPLAPREYLEAVGMTPWGAVYSTEDIWREDSRILDLLRISTVLLDPNSSEPSPAEDSLLRGGSAIGGGNLVRYEYKPRLPQAFVVGSTTLRPRPDVLSALRGRTPFDPAQVGLIESVCPMCPTGPPGSAGNVQGTRWGLNSLVVDVVSSRAGLLVVSQAWFPGWHATVDGREVPVVRVDGLVQGIPIASDGRHRVMLNYRAPGLYLGLAVSLAMFFLFGAWLTFGSRNGRLRETGEPL